jgi:hypothetical protein
MHQYSAEEKNSEIEGPGGIKMTGGDLTPPQNAGETLATVNKERRDSQKMEERQLAGDVEQQRTSLHPSAADPEGMDEPVQGQSVESNNS